MTMTQERLVIKAYMSNNNSFDTIGVYNIDSRMSRLRKIADECLEEGYDYAIIDSEVKDWIPSEDNGVGGFVEGGWSNWEVAYTDYRVEKTGW